ncbi:MAG: sulfurtransferase complex subunit TusB [Thermoproteota archaeon]|nr:MAG: sulfurtransferase complex subunit TusB [Candidatus Korarchaeota archaeon]
MRLLILATKPPSRLGELTWVLELATEVKRGGGEVALYLAGDAVLAARRQCRTVKMLASAGCEVYVCRKDLEARGVKESSLLDGVRVLEDFYLQLVEDAVERCSHVVSV